MYARSQQSQKNSVFSPTVMKRKMESDISKLKLTKLLTKKNPLSRDKNMINTLPPTKQSLLKLIFNKQISSPAQNI